MPRSPFNVLLADEFYIEYFFVFQGEVEFALIVLLPWVFLVILGSLVGRPTLISLWIDYWSNIWFLIAFTGLTVWSMARQILVSSTGLLGIGLQPGPLTAPIVRYISNMVFLGAFFLRSYYSSCANLLRVYYKFIYFGPFLTSSASIRIWAFSRFWRISWPAAVVRSLAY